MFLKQLFCLLQNIIILDKGDKRLKGMVILLFTKNMIYSRNQNAFMPLSFHALCTWVSWQPQLFSSCMCRLDSSLLVKRQHISQNVSLKYLISKVMNCYFWELHQWFILLPYMVKVKCGLQVIQVFSQNLFS